MNNIENIAAVLNAKELNPRIKMFRELRHVTQYNMESVFNIIKDNYKLSEIINKEYLCESDQELFKWDIDYDMSNDGSLMNLLKWGQSLLRFYSDSIGEFISLKQTYEKFLFEENFLEAYRVILKIDKKISHSVWGIHQKIMLSELSESIDYDIHKLLKHNGTVSLLGHYYYKMVDKDINFLQYNNSIFDLLKTADRTTPSWRYFNYKLNIISEVNIQEIKVALLIDEQISIIDYYETYIDILQSVAEKRNFEAIVKEIIYGLNDLFDDYRIRNMNIAYNGVKGEIVIDNEISSVIEQYTCGQNDILKENIKVLLKKYGDDFSLCCLFVKAKINISEKRDAFKELWEEIESIYRVNYEIEKSIARIGKYYKLLYGTSWRSKLHSVMVRKLNLGGNNDVLKKAILNDMTLTPLFYQCIQDNQQKFEYLSKMKIFMPCTIELHKYMLSGESIDQLMRQMIDTSRLNFYEIKYLLFSSQYEICISKSLDFLNTVNLKNQYMQERTRRILFESYLGLRLLNDAMRLYVNSYLLSAGFVLHMELDRLVNFIDDCDEEKIKADICRPLIMRFRYPDNDENVISSYLDYLESQNISTIVELLKCKKNMSELDILFLDKVCTQSLLMKDYVSKTEVGGSAAELRAMILHHLLEQDKDNKKKYLIELNAIYKDMQLQKKIKAFNHNRIFIDREKLYIFLSKDLKQEFAKFRVVQEIRKVLEDSEYETAHMIFPMESYWDLAKFFYSIVKKIASAYLNDSPYSLENFLSTRIRHNYCKDNLKKQFEEQKLFSKKELDTSKDYTINEFWKDKIFNSDYAIVMEILSKFSSGIDLKIQEIRDEWIRIRREEYPKGMFDYSDFTDFFVKYVVLDFDNMMSNTMEFFTEVVSQLDNWTDNILKKIRDRIENELKPYYNNKLLELEKEIKQCKIQEKNKTELLRKIEISKAKYVEDLDSFKDIFYMENENYPDFTLRDLVEFCCKIEDDMNNEFSSAKVKVDINVNDIYIGKIFPYMVDVLGNLIRNGVQHSEFDKLKDLIIEIEVSDYKGGELEKIFIESYHFDMPFNIVIRVRNNLNDIVNKQDVIQRVNQKIENIEKKKYRSESMKEGGSGLYKIARTIDYSLSTNAAFYNNHSADYFDISIAMDLKKYIKKG
ncbi:MAG: hypothetical protein HFI70_07450 [Lachnospiraceae bacterium]|nr:hypothetical protein [Lachnospiraceae bacterium]